MKMTVNSPKDEWVFCLLPCIAWGKYYNAHCLKYQHYVQLGWLLWNVVFDFE